MDGPEITCVNCGKTAGLFDYQLSEAATLTCPVCNTQFAITATLKNKGGEQPEIGKPEGGPELPPPPSPTPGPPPGGPPVPGPTPGIERQGLESAAATIVGYLEEGLGLDESLDKLLCEAEPKEKEEWKGTLGAFNTKLQSLANDVGYNGDLGDLVTDLMDGDAVTLSGETVKFDIEKAKKVLLRHLIGKGPNQFKDPDIEGDLLDFDGIDDLDREVSSRTGGPKNGASVGKALETYFS